MGGSLVGLGGLGVMGRMVWLATILLLKVALVMVELGNAQWKYIKQ